jgi:ATP-binding cassette subfamily B protein
MVLSSSPPSGTDGSRTSLPIVDVKAMPRILLRLTRLALRYPWRCSVAVGSALGAAVLNLVTPRLLGGAVDQARLLLADAHADPIAAHRALLITAGLVILASAARGNRGAPKTALGRRSVAGTRNQRFLR